jgi:osmotically-inducible protein OsmY
MRPSLPSLLLSLLALSTLSGCAAVVVTGAATGALMADDRRTSATYVMDQEIELKASNRLREKNLNDVYVSFTSFNRRALITGQAPNEAIKAEMTDIARSVPNVRDVVNEITLGAPSSFPTHSNDAYITTAVKARLLNAKQLDANHVKVVTESGVVYLMGLVKQAEGDLAAEQAASTSGVKRVVKVFEYIAP